ncbi:hypothetical protein TBR22_A00180 [Luteitalea sp. TBR-22]|uniref:hypothetical protein n=1 Tax=Luteitalea sp. TBR-22 TaxID=2802971 RepID=UPI001AF39CBC|nr:hypothetical protein [Luteitalea sp. TBR-22]BCS30818.1 hypothetical protein TBR22_A00180 [Luteitalea sp. TBR-22]
MCRRSWLLVVIICTLAGHATAAPVTLRFKGTTDLSSVGGKVDSTFAGEVTWDPTMPCNANGQEYSSCRFDPDYSDGAEPTGHFSIDGIDFTDRIAPYSRLEVFPYDLFLEFWFEPVGGPHIMGIDRAYLSLWSPRSWAAGTPVFDGSLPEHLGFLSRLERKEFVLTGPWDPDGETPMFRAEASTLLVGEPGLLTMLEVSLCAALAHRSRRRRH